MMNGILWHKVGRDLWQNRTRTLLVVLSIAVGTFAIGLVGTVQQELLQALNSSYLASNPAHSLLFAASDQGFDEQALQLVQNLEGVQTAEGRSVLITRAQIGSDEWQDFVIFAKPDLADSQIAQFERLTGQWPPTTGNILLERDAFASLPVAEGARLIIRTPDGSKHELRIAGTVHDPSRGTLAIGDPAAGYISMDTLNTLGITAGFSEILIRLDEAIPAPERAVAVGERSLALLQKAGYVVETGAPAKYKEHPFTDSLRTIVLVLVVLGVLALLMTGSLVVNTMGAVMTQEVRQIGVLKTVGARRLQIVSLYLRLVLVHGLLALILSLPLTIVAAYGLTTFLGHLFNTDIVDFAVPPLVIGLQVLASVLLPVLFTLRTAVMGTSSTVHEALSDYGLDSQSRQSWLVQVLVTMTKRFKRLPRFPVWLHFSLRNVLRRRQRALFTFLTLLLGDLLFVSVFSLHASQMRALDRNLAPFTYDIKIGLSQPASLEAAKQTLTDVENIADLEEWTVTRGMISNNRTAQSDDWLRVTALPADTTMIDFTLLEGRWLRPDDQNAMVIDHSAQFDHPELVLDHEVTINLDGTETVWQVVGIVERIQLPGAYITNSGYEQQTGNQGKANFIYLRTTAHNAKAQLATGRTVEQELDSEGIALSSVRTSSEVRETEARGFHLIRMFLLSMVTVVSVVGGLGLAGTLAINVVERIREIGILRALGATNGTIVRILLAEALLLSFIAWLLATLLSIPVSRLLIYAIELLTDEPLPYTFAIASPLAWLGVMLLLATLASIIPARQATRIAVREALVYE